MIIALLGFLLILLFNKVEKLGQILRKKMSKIRDKNFRSYIIKELYNFL